MNAAHHLDHLSHYHRGAAAVHQQPACLEHPGRNHRAAAGRHRPIHPHRNCHEYRRNIAQDRIHGDPPGTLARDPAHRRGPDDHLRRGGVVVLRRGGGQRRQSPGADRYMITGLMVASIAVEPFLYAALFIQMAILLAIPLMTSIYEAPSKGITRFLVYQTLAMPFILVAGWLLGGETSRVTWPWPRNRLRCWGWGLLSCLQFSLSYLDPHAGRGSFALYPGVHPVNSSHDHNHIFRGFYRPLLFYPLLPQLITALRLTGLAMLVTGESSRLSSATSHTSCPMAPSPRRVFPCWRSAWI